MTSGKRAASLFGSVAVLITDVKNKDTYLKITVPDLFYGDRKKFKAYYI
jgi:hypothetical protein